MKPATRTIVGLLALWSGVNVPAQAAEVPSDLYERMREAVRLVDYEGRFVYQVGDDLYAMYVVNRMQQGRKLERLVSLDGAPKQVIRGAMAVACLDSKQKKISLVGAKSKLGDAPVVGTGELTRFYRFELGDEYRVAGRPARELLIHPRDDLRFGYRIALDRKTDLPLRSVMLDQAERVRSQTLFVDLKTGRQVTPIEHDLSALQMTEMPVTGSITSGTGDAADTYPEITLGELPPGFRLIDLQTPETDVRHLLLTDGLASVSLYVEPLDEQPLEGYSNAGSTEIFATRRQNLQIIVVGEVPRKTLGLIASAVELR